MQVVDTFTIPTNTDAPRRAREAVSRVLADRGTLVRFADTARFDDVQLAVSELVTNAVRHTDSRVIELTVQLVDERIRVTVSDSSTEIPLIPSQGPSTLRPIPAAVTAAMTASLACRGLLLVAALTDDWGTEAADNGKAVWFEIAC